MLDRLRYLGRTWLGKIVGAFLLVGLAGFGISNVLLDFGTGNVAKVGDEDISTIAFQRAYNDDLNRYAQQIGRVPLPQEALAWGIPSGTLGRLAADAAINQLGRKMELGVSEDRLGKMLREDPTFAGTLGQFDPRAFSQVLQRSGFTEAEYFDLQSRAARRQQMFAGLFADSPAPAAAEELLNGYSGDTRTIEYVVLNPQTMPAVAEPTDAELAAYLSEHQTQFRTQEMRTIDLLVLNIDTLSAVQEVTDEEIAAEFERTRDSRIRVEKRTIRQAPLNAEQQAAFEAGLAAGRSFDELAAETGASIVDLGTLSEAEVTDKALASAAFGLEAGKFVLIPGAGGSRAVTVSAIEPGGVATLDESRDEIARSLKAAKARNAYLDILDQIEELRAAFQPLPRIAERFNLPVETVTLSSAGTQLASVATLTDEERTRVAQAVFAAREDNLAPTVAFSANDNAWFDLKSIEAARDQTLDEVRDAVTAAITEERAEAAMDAEVDTIVRRLRAGETFDDVALSLNLVPTPSQPLTRSGDGTPVLNQDVAAAAFNGGEGHFGAATNGDGDRVIFQVTEIQPATTTNLAAAKAYVEETTRQSLYEDFITGLRDQAGVRVNQQALNQLLALDQQ